MNTEQQRCFAIAQNTLGYLENVQDLDAERGAITAFLRTLPELLTQLEILTQLKVWLIQQMKELSYDASEFRHRARQLNYVFKNSIAKVYEGHEGGL